MPIKRLLCPARGRRVPKQFSWVDQRLVRDHYVERCDAYALALYGLFIVMEPLWKALHNGSYRSTIVMQSI
jgi:hypothetical protein